MSISAQDAHLNGNVERSHRNISTYRHAQPEVAFMARRAELHLIIADSQSHEPQILIAARDSEALEK